MKVHPLIRLSLLVLIIIVNFFVIVINVNSLSNQNQELNTVRTEIRKAEITLVNNRAKTEKTIDEEIRAQQNTENLQLVSPAETVKINLLSPKNTSSQSSSPRIISGD